MISYFSVVYTSLPEWYTLLVQQVCAYHPTRRWIQMQLRQVSTLDSVLKNPKSLYNERKQDMIDKQKTVAEQELITLLSRLSPVEILITPHTREDGSTVYAWQAWESSGTHPAVLGAVKAALEAAMVSLAYAPVSPEARLTQADFPPRLGYA